MWFNKENPNTVFMDKKKKIEDFSHSKLNVRMSPDIQAVWEYLPFPDETFEMVVFDPPHMIENRPLDCNSIFVSKYGLLRPQTYRRELFQAGKEFWRVLKKGGFLVFKWNDCSRKFDRVIQYFPNRPLFYQKSKGSAGQSSTFWAVFQKT